ncbi:hypothetical protein BDY17DRAFT_60045 [Neohortaea acidophila]|uniref:Uncharacterized protein n=1 Tax=Neohortaea acidophila TaxID=245834 RepID=A0A6A6PHS9_9PEZI|nr:uncharacterized protein BDY17DRAFT_60045 [Neohortaea acidophila]KAF2478827.1 hypothetical protein BDY17DRAFT_60045 [Neohortaea acidophila]
MRKSTCIWKTTWRSHHGTLTKIRLRDATNRHESPRTALVTNPYGSRCNSRLHKRATRRIRPHHRLSDRGNLVITKLAPDLCAHLLRTSGASRAPMGPPSGLARPTRPWIGGVPRVHGPVFRAPKSAGLKTVLRGLSETYTFSDDLRHCEQPYFQVWQKNRARSWIAIAEKMNRW